MYEKIIIEAIGYAGSILIVISMIMTSLKKIRIINGLGSIIFSVYALIIKSYPTAFMNLFLVGINVVNLIKIIRAEKNYSIIECYKDESFVQQYLKSHLDDIKIFFPEFDLTDGGHLLAFMVFTGSNPIGITIGKIQNNSTFEVQLDYTIPSYRDFSVGKFLYTYLKEKWFIETIIQKGLPTPAHADYLEKAGFIKTEKGYSRNLHSESINPS